MKEEIVDVRAMREMKEGQGRMRQRGEGEKGL